MAESSPLIDFRVRLPEDRRPDVTLPDAATERYDDLLDLRERMGRTGEQLLHEIDANGIYHAVVHAEYEYGDIADQLNEAVAEFVGEHAERLSGFGTVSLDSTSVTRVVGQVRDAARLGLRGINLQPAFFGRAIDDRELYAAYAAAQESELIVAVHTGVGFNTSRPMDGEQPFRLDRVACAFPGLRLVGCHGGWPWATELAAVARKHRDVYIDFGGMSPRYLGEPGTGWETLFRYANSLLSEQVLFATDWPTFDLDRAVAECRALSLKPVTLQRLLGGNAAALLGLPATPA